MRRRIYQLSIPRELPVSSISFATCICCSYSKQATRNSRISSKVTTSPPNLRRRSVSPDSHLDVRFQPAIGSASTSLASPACTMDSASALRSRSSRCCRNAHCFSWCPTPTKAARCFPASEKQVGHAWAVSRTYPIQLNCTDSRPRTRWYQLRGLPLVGSECVCPQCNSISFVITRGSAKPSASPFIYQELTRNANRKSGTPVIGKSPTVKCPMIRPQWYNI